LPGIRLGIPGFKNVFSFFPAQIKIIKQNVSTDLYVLSCRIWNIFFFLPKFAGKAQMFWQPDQGFFATEISALRRVVAFWHWIYLVMATRRRLVKLVIP
jgi:hypothetical protein